jgi:hypothetical protein
MAGPPKPMSIQTTSLFLADNHKQIVGRNIGSAHWHLRMLEFAALHGIRKLKVLTKSGSQLRFLELLFSDNFHCLFFIVWQVLLWRRSR